VSEDKRYSAEDFAILQKPLRKFIKSLGFDPDNLPDDEVSHMETCHCCQAFLRMEQERDMYKNLHEGAAIGNQVFYRNNKLYRAFHEHLCHLAKQKRGEWLDISTAPKDGTRVLLKFKDNLRQFDGIVEGDGFSRIDGFSGLEFVGRHHGFGKHGDFDMGWSFAAPVGMGGFCDGWLVGWQPLPTPAGATNV